MHIKAACVLFISASRVCPFSASLRASNRCRIAAPAGVSVIVLVASTACHTSLLRTCQSRQPFAKASASSGLAAAHDCTICSAIAACSSFSPRSPGRFCAGQMELGAPTKSTPTTSNEARIPASPITSSRAGTLTRLLYSSKRFSNFGANSKFSLCSNAYQVSYARCMFCSGEMHSPSLTVPIVISCDVFS